MKIIGEIEANIVSPAFGNVISQMKRGRPGGEVAVIIYDSGEVMNLRAEFMNYIKKNKLHAADKSEFEKAEMMHMIGVALRSSNVAQASWWKEKASKMYCDAIEFDRNSSKTLLIGKGVVAIVIVYNGEWVKGDGYVEDNSGDSDGSLDNVG